MAHKFCVAVQPETIFTTVVGHCSKINLRLSHTNTHTCKHTQNCWMLLVLLMVFCCHEKAISFPMISKSRQRLPTIISISIITTSNNTMNTIKSCTKRKQEKTYATRYLWLAVFGFTAVIEIRQLTMSWVCSAFLRTHFGWNFKNFMALSLVYTNSERKTNNIYIPSNSFWYLVSGFWFAVHSSYTKKNTQCELREVCLVWLLNCDTVESLAPEPNVDKYLCAWNVHTHTHK